MDLAEYQAINNGFKRSLVFHLGADAGFLSEFNNMVLAMLYCLKHEIRFVLYSDRANFRVKRGWEDFFAPFCDETRIRGHRWFNKRYPKQASAAHRRGAFLFKKLIGVDFLTYEIWSEMRSRGFARQTFSFSRYRDLDMQSAGRVLVSLIWNYSATARERIEALKRSVSLPENYLGIHVRAGDKHIETKLLHVSRYIEKAQSISHLREVFLSTDDYSVYEEACQRYPDYSFVTLCMPGERGYFHRQYMKRSKRFRARELRKFFASLDLLAGAEYFVGTFTSNIGVHLGMRMDRDRVFAADDGAWRI